MADKARELTDKKLIQMERKVNDIYTEAYSGISARWNSYMKSHESKLKQAYEDLHEAIKSGDKEEIEKTKAVYEHTAKNITVNNKRFQGMVDETASKITNVNQVALSYVNDQMPSVYTVNYNAFANENISGYSFSLVNEEAVKTLANSNKILLPKRKVDVPKDIRWNEKLINSQVLQGILQGESIPKIAKRLRNVTDMNRKSAIRNARTMTTSAENKGRQDSFVRATKDGVILKRVWVATHDERTRAWHDALDGAEVDVEEAWSNEYGEILYPGDPSADPCNVYNCRCAMRVVVKGYKWNEEETEKDIYNELLIDELHTDDEEAYNKLVNTIQANNITHLDVKPLSQPLDTSAIADKLSGGDMTKGSCASLSLAFAGNKCGLDVTDFRGGTSQQVFSRPSNIEAVFKTANAKYTTYKVKKEVDEVAQIIKGIPKDKEFILSAGKHAAVIRNTEGVGLEYLELQSATSNGWKPFAWSKTRNYTLLGQEFTEEIKYTEKDTLQKRFGCRKSAQTISIGGQKVAFEHTAYLAEVDSFKATKEFKDILGYINTKASAQKKGVSGFER